MMKATKSQIISFESGKSYFVSLFSSNSLKQLSADACLYQDSVLSDAVSAASPSGMKRAEALNYVDEYFSLEDPKPFILIF
jgi:hypothetical protein